MSCSGLSCPVLLGLQLYSTSLIKHTVVKIGIYTNTVALVMISKTRTRLESLLVIETGITELTIPTRSVNIKQRLSSCCIHLVLNIKCFRYGPPTRTDYRVLVENLSTRVSWQVGISNILLLVERNFSPVKCLYTRTFRLKRSPIFFPLFFYPVATQLG